MPQPARSGGFNLRLSLRQRVLLLLVVINVAVVGAEVGFLAQGLARSRSEEAGQYAAEFVSLLRGEIQPGRGLNVKRLLLNRKVLVYDAETTFLSHANCGFKFCHGVHRRTDQREVQRYIAAKSC